MSTQLYDKAREGFATKKIDWVGDSIKAVLIDTAQYTVNIATHQYLSDIPSGARVAISPALTGKTAAAGVCDADDTTFASVSGPTYEAMALFVDTGDPVTSRLIPYIDNASGDFPGTPSGSDILVAWSNGPNKIFKL